MMRFASSPHSTRANHSPGLLPTSVIHGILVPLMILSFGHQVLAGKQPPAVISKSEQAFLDRHWPDAIPPQGSAPAQPDDPAQPTGHSKLELSLAPTDCGVCHRRQFEDWRTSLHSHSMGPGVLGQMAQLVKNDPDTAQLCWRCHTPLVEQQELLRSTSSSGITTWGQNPAFERTLFTQGLICAACHVRQQQRFGPPRKGTPRATGKFANGLPHNGFTATTAFTKSAFCSVCHQFKSDGYALNGKLLENTYQEWLASDYAARGVQCQDCHMPERRHLWRGIHDPDMVKKGLTFSIHVPPKTYRKGDTIEALITVANTGVGHYFPTYMVPKVYIRGRLTDRNGTVLANTALEAVIGRETTLDLSAELYDTRIPPGESLSVTYVQQLPQDHLQLQVEISVEPDHFYARFFEAMLANSSGGGNNYDLINKALTTARQSSFSIYKKTIPLF